MNYREFKKYYKLQLDKQQDMAVQTVDGPSMILAVPGSGKTTVLVSRLGYMIYGLGILPENILTLTYTVAATNDMRQRFEQYFGKEDSDRLEFRTINGLSQKVLAYYGERTGKKPFDLVDKEASSIIREAYMKVNDGFPTDNDISNISLGIGYVKNMCYTDSMIKKYKCDVDNFYLIYSCYNRILRERSLIDYDDQMVYAKKILESVPALLDYFQSKYKYICVDEAQDTSKIQHQIIELLAKKNGNLFMVGDEDQSIYGFRAAYPSALLDFEKNHKDSLVHLLETNYRSGSEIVQASNLLIRKNLNRHPKDLIAARVETGKVSRLDTASRKSQYSYLAKVCRQNEIDTAILYRNNESALPLIDVLERNRIPYRLKNSDGSFFSHPIVNDIRDFISLAYNPCDYDAFMRIYYKMNIKISKVLAQGAVYNCGSSGILDYLSNQASLSDGMRKRVYQLSRDFIKLKADSASDAIDRIVEEMGYRKFMESRSMDFTKLDIIKLLSKECNNLMSLQERLEVLKDIVISGSFCNDANVTLSTIHSAKGLEFDRVYMMDLVEGVLPSVKKPNKYSTKEEVDAYEEERRLYYVGMTRAKEELYIFTFDYDSTSQFSRELFSIKRPKSEKTTSYMSSGLIKTNYGKAKPKGDL